MLLSLGWQRVRHNWATEQRPRILYPVKLSFKFDGEIKSFPDKQKVNRIQRHQTSFTTNAKGTSLSRKEEKERTYLQKISPKQWKQ